MNSHQPRENGRPESDLLQPAVALDGQQQPIVIRPASSAVGAGMSSVSEQAESDVHYLMTSNKLALLLAREWHIIGMPHAFENLDTYRDVAQRSGCHIVTVTEPQAGGLESFLFLTRTPGLADDDYLACVEEPVIP